MMRRNKKGFTIVELVIVIAVIAILAAVLIPTFSDLIKKANISADTQLCKNMNTALSIAESEGAVIEDMDDVLFHVNEAGYIIEHLNPTTEGYYFAWDAGTNQILFLDNEYSVHYSSEDPSTNKALWWVTVGGAAEAKTITDANMSIYLEKNIAEAIEITKPVSINTGEYVADNLSYKLGDTAAPFTIKGKYTSVTIDAPNAEIEQFGSIDTLRVGAVADATLKINGNVKSMTLAKGHVEVSKAGNIDNVLVKPVTGGTEGQPATKITNNGTIALIAVAKGSPSSADITIVNSGWVKDVGTVDESTTTIGSDTVVSQNTELEEAAKTSTTPADGFAIEIGTLAELESFRDQVNGGRFYKGLTVELTADIDLKGYAWTPIGEFGREVNGGRNHTFGFAGTFDGKGHTIKNLSNKGFSVSSTALSSNDTTPVDDTKKYQEYVYGLFGTVINATIRNLNMTNVEIDFVIDKYNRILGDSMGGIVGYAGGTEKFTIENCTVSGSIKGFDATGGIVGRIYAYTAEVKNCTNNATVTAARRAGGIVGYTATSGKNTCTFNTNTNNGDVTSLGNAHKHEVLDKDTENKANYNRVAGIAILSMPESYNSDGENKNAGNVASQGDNPGGSAKIFFIGEAPSANVDEDKG